MKPDLVTLKSWIETQYRSYPSIPPRQQKEETAHELGCGVATLYRWLKAGNVYIEFVGASIAGDDSGIVVWKIEKSIFE